MSRTNPRIPVPTLPANEGTLLGGPNIVVPVRQTAELATRRIRGTIILFPLVVLAIAIFVRDAERSERTLEAEGAESTRVVVYELDIGRDLRVPIEPGTDVFRVVMHAAQKNGQPLTPQPHVAKVHFTAHGDKGSLDEVRAISAPGATSRVTAEDQGILVGDPVGVSVDVHDVGVGELVMSLDAMDSADALMVRVYRRDELRNLDAIRRTERLGEDKLAHRARHAGELDWVDLDSNEQNAILGAKWRKVGALSGTNDLVARAIALAPPETPTARAHDDVGIATFSIVGDERAAIIAHGPTTVHARVDDPEEPLSATVRYEDGTVAQVDSKGELLMKVPDGNVVGVEMTTPDGHPIEVRAADPQRVEPPTRAAYWRASPALPATVTAGQTPLVVRVTARRAVPRTSAATFPINLTITVTPSAGAPTTTPVHGERGRSRFDRYEGRDPNEAPTDKLAFYVIVPAHGTAQITPMDGPLDLSFSELDPGAMPRKIASYSPNAKHDPIAKIGDVDWPGFVARRPSNGQRFEPDAHGLVRVAHRDVPAPEPAEHPASLRIARPRVEGAIAIEDRVFDPASAKFDFQVPGGEHVALPVHLYSAEPIDIIARIDDGAPRRVAMGVAGRVTVDRTFEVLHEKRAVIVLGDDLAPGHHTLRFEVPEGKQAWVHLPWLKAARRVVRPAAKGPPRWVEGEFDD